jgi:hypothetical protein
MDGSIFTLQEFYTFTKGVTYIIMVLALLGVTAFWLFLAGGRDQD